MTSQSDSKPDTRSFVPEKTKILFIAESPPISADEHFYSPNAKEQDWLWVSLMKAIYSDRFGDDDVERDRKNEWLLRFMIDGYQVINAFPRPFKKEPSESRIKLIQERVDVLVEEIWKISPDCIVLVKYTVYDALFSDLAGFEMPVVNCRLPYPVPDYGKQEEFLEKFSSLVADEQIVLTHLQK